MITFYFVSLSAPRLRLRLLMLLSSPPMRHAKGRCKGGLFCSSQGHIQWPVFCASSLLCRRNPFSQKGAAGNYKPCRKVWSPWRPPFRPLNDEVSPGHCANVRADGGYMPDVCVSQWSLACGFLLSKAWVLPYLFDSCANGQKCRGSG